MAAILGVIVYSITELVQVIMFVLGCYFFSISIFSWVKKKEDSKVLNRPQKKFALLVAAHNEELVIGHSVFSLKKQNYPKDLYQIYVIADNCTDRTAEIARTSGAKVLSRENELLRGKGYALQWAFDKIFEGEEQFDAVAVFDADNLVSSNFLIEMNKQLLKGYKAVQGYIDSKNPFDSWITCSYSIAFWLANRLFQLPRYYLGLSCSLCGTGFCVDTSVLKKIGWGASCLTEDLEFTMKLALNDIKVGWANEAIVYDEKPITLKQSWAQRKRWMQGHVDCAGRFLVPLLSKAFKGGDLTAFDSAVYLFQPVRFICMGLITIMLWVKTIYPEVPFYHYKSMFSSGMWYWFIAFQLVYGPFVAWVEKKINAFTLMGFFVYPLYCVTWVPITIQGFLGRKNKNWSHTAHTRAMEGSLAREGFTQSAIVEKR